MTLVRRLSFAIKALLAVTCCVFSLNALAITIAEIDVAASKANTRDLGEAADQTVLSEIYDAAREFVTTAQHHQEIATQYENTIRRGPAHRAEIERSIEQTQKRLAESALTKREQRFSEDKLQRLLAETESILASLEDQRFELEERERDLLSRPDQLRAERIELTTRIANLDVQRGASDSSLDQIAQARQILTQAELDALRAELQRLEQDLLSQNARLEIVHAEQLLLETKYTVESRRKVELEAVLLTQRRDAARSVLEVVADAADDANATIPPVKKLLDENAGYAREILTVIEKQSSTAARRNALKEKYDALHSAFTRSQDRLKYAGYGSGVGHLLINQRRQIPDVDQLEREADRRRRTVAGAGLRSIELDDRLRVLKDVPALTLNILEDYVQKQPSVSLPANAQRTLAENLQSQTELLAQLTENYAEYLDTLSDLEYEAQQVAHLAQTYGAYIDEKIIWIPNAPVFGRTILLDSAHAVGFGLSWSNPAAIWSDLRSGALTSPLRFGALVVLLIFIVGIRPRISQVLESLSGRVKKIHTDRFRYTLAAIGGSIIFAIPWPLFLWSIGKCLTASVGVSPVAVALAAALHSIVPILFVTQWLRRLLRDEGVGRLHFRWRDGLISDIRRMTVKFELIFLPSYFVAMFFEHQSNAAYQYGLGRLAFICAMLATTLFLYRLLRGSGSLMRHLTVRYPNALMTRMRGAILLVAFMLPLLFAILAAVGYYYTALNLTRYLLATGAFIILTIVLRSLAVRWLYLAEARLALKRARERREAEAESLTMDGELQEVSVDDLPIDIATINAQTRMMLSNIVGWSFAIGIYFIWAGALPALGILESVDLWHIQIPGSQGTEVQSITLATLLLAVIIVTVTMIAAKNIPGVLEIGLLQRLPLQPGSRYAITTLSQYLIIAVGIIVAFGALGARWSQIQWLVAALSVGLGFGLQEIVANFISGIILLFERPIRVGDTVTIGELTGKIARIRIRATTIVDWDNKEIVVPNKNFITERFVNWTLSDPIIRVKINIGIAYGSDVARALEIMHHAATAQEKILTEPAPRALFLGFGDSSLDFEILVYIRDMTDRLPVIHDMHVAINQGFADADIVIPFPQRDVHVHSAASDGGDFDGLLRPDSV